MSAVSSEIALLLIYLKSSGLITYFVWKDIPVYFIIFVRADAAPRRRRPLFIKIINQAGINK